MLSFPLPLLADLTDDERSQQRQLGSGQAECLARQGFINAIHLVQHLAGLNLGDVVLGIALTVTHTDFSRLLRDRLVRENADPDTTATLDVTGHGATRGFDLASRD